MEKTVMREKDEGRSGGDVVSSGSGVRLRPLLPSHEHH